MLNLRSEYLIRTTLLKNIYVFTKQRLLIATINFCHCLRQKVQEIALIMAQ